VVLESSIGPRASGELSEPRRSDRR